MYVSSFYVYLIDSLAAFKHRCWYVGACPCYICLYVCISVCECSFFVCLFVCLCECSFCLFVCLFCLFVYMWICEVPVGICIIHYYLKKAIFLFFFKLENKNEPANCQDLCSYSDLRKSLESVRTRFVFKLIFYNGDKINIVSLHFFLMFRRLISSI